MKRAYKPRATATAFTLCIAECMRCGNSVYSALNVARLFMRDMRRALR